MMDDIYYVSDETTVHVYEGMKNVGIYDKETGVPKFVDLEREVMYPKDYQLDGADRDGDMLDKDWARDRNREIEKEVDTLREQINIFAAYYSDKWEHIDVMEERIEDLLEERDKNTRKFGLSGENFNQKYEDVTLYDKLISSGIPMSVIEEKPKNNYGPSYKEAQFRSINEEMLDLYSRKNADYGGSFDESLDEDGLLVAKIRLKDKLNRFSQLIDSEGLVEDESIRDTLIDLANYSVMTLMWLNDAKD